MLGFHFLQTFLDQEDNIFLEGVNHFLEECSPPTFLMEEANDTPTHKIAVETLHPERMVMTCIMPNCCLSTFG